MIAGMRCVGPDWYELAVHADAGQRVRVYGCRPGMLEALMQGGATGAVVGCADDASLLACLRAGQERAFRVDAETSEEALHLAHCFVLRCVDRHSTWLTGPWPRTLATD